MFEYFVLSYIKGDEEILCLDTAKDSEDGKAAFDKILAEGLFEGDLLLVKVVRSAELSYDVREHPEEREETTEGVDRAITECGGYIPEGRAGC